jgi:tetratricopeptide (TPR) repeat protein
VLSFEPAQELKALELLEQAMESSPRDALPVALASWCRGLLGGHHFVQRPQEQRNAARALAMRASHLNAADALTQTILGAGYTLAHDLAAAAIHVDRALMLDGGSAWAWGRSGWVKAYGGEPVEAIERFQIARDMAPGDPLKFLCAIGIGSAYLEQTQYAQAIDWYECAMTERPTAVWNDRFRAAAYALAGRKEEARRTLAGFTRMYPDVTITLVRAGLPHTSRFLDRVAEGLEIAGMRP